VLSVTRDNVEKPVAFFFPVRCSPGNNDIQQPKLRVWLLWMPALQNEFLHFIRSEEKIKKSKREELQPSYGFN
jgi:hypothetical protein